MWRVIIAVNFLLIRDVCLSISFDIRVFINIFSRIREELLTAVPMKIIRSTTTLYQSMPCPFLRTQTKFHSPSSVKQCNFTPDLNFDFLNQLFPLEVQKIVIPLYIHVAHQILLLSNMTRGLFLESPKNFSYLESPSKISTLMITKQFYSHILNMNL